MSAHMDSSEELARVRRAAHIELHRSLDVLLSAWLRQLPFDEAAGVLDRPVRDLVAWSAMQTRERQ